MEQLPRAMSAALAMRIYSLSLYGITVTPIRRRTLTTTAMHQGTQSPTLAPSGDHYGCAQLPELLPFVDSAECTDYLPPLRPVIEVAVGVREVGKHRFLCFSVGDPSERERSSLVCSSPPPGFAGRSPEGVCSSPFSWEDAKRSYIDLSDKEIRKG